jgi:hypothetical protein
MLMSPRRAPAHAEDLPSAHAFGPCTDKYMPYALHHVVASGVYQAKYERQQTVQLRQPDTLLERKKLKQAQYQVPFEQGFMIEESAPETNGFNCNLSMFLATHASKLVS